MRVRILPYRAGSHGARVLAEAIGTRVLRLRNSTFHPRPGDIIVNWGYKGMEWVDMAEDHIGFTILNSPFNVRLARDKLTTFQYMREASVPSVEWTEDKGVALRWLAEGSGVFVRSTTTGQGGAGIVYVSPDMPDTHVLPDAPLYTKRFRAAHEYRVHVVRDQFFATKKRRRNGAEPNVVRNYANNYVYCTNNVVPPLDVVSVALRAVAALGLDFGAVDVMCTNEGEARVLEVNTAPGLEGRTVAWYADRINDVIGRAA